MNDGKTRVFPAVAFPKDFKEQIMKGKRTYDFDFLIKNGFAMIYTLIGDEEGLKEFKEILKRTFDVHLSKVVIMKMGDKPPKKFFNDILFGYYDILRGTQVHGEIPLNILIMLTYAGQLFNDSEETSKIYQQIVENEMNNAKIYFLVLSTKEIFVEEPLINTILDAHLDNLRKMIESNEKKQKSHSIKNYGVMITGNNNTISNIKIDYFKLIYEEIENRNPKNRKEIIEAVEKIEKGENKEKYLKFLKENASWILSLIEFALKFKTG